MRFITKYYKECRIAFIKSAFFVIGLCVLFCPTFVIPESEGENMFVVKLNGKEVGCVGSSEEAGECLKNARAEIQKENEDLVFVKTEISCESKESWFGKTDPKSDVIYKMKDVMMSDRIADRKTAYMIKVNDFTTNVESAEAVTDILQAALDKYAENNPYRVELVPDPDREINVLTTRVVDSTKQINDQTQTFTAGFARAMHDMDAESEMRLRMSFDDFDYGLVDISYDDKVEVIETFVSPMELMASDQAKEILTKDQDKPAIYEVKSGDTLSEIALDVDIPLDKLVEMNSELLEDENSPIRVGEELVITVPEPELSVGRKEEIYYEEAFDAPVEYVYNDSWYTTDSAIRQQPSAGYRQVAAVVSYHNDRVTDTDILKEVDTISPVAKIVEVGTKAPPSYIKPISGGRLTSGFGPRSRPTKGASSYHRGIDWATPTGTAVYASCAGTVARAGWGSGYGYVVYINHEDGRQTRYGHLSKVLVTVGQKVNQGEKIALSGSTGVSTGPHIHFEILINGTQVNPLNYIN